MGGHGGLNILPQKRWNVYNFDNREKVRKDEEAAAKAEQIKREQSRKRDTELRLQQIRKSRAPQSSSTPLQKQQEQQEQQGEAKPSKHINLFEGIKVLDPSKVLGNELRRDFKKMKKEAEVVKVVLPEDEKYRLGYGVVGRGVKVPWYMDGKKRDEVVGVEEGEEGGEEAVSRKRRRKSVEELREERLKREAREKERERALLRPKGRGGWIDGGCSTKYTR